MTQNCPEALLVCSLKYKSPLKILKKKKKETHLCRSHLTLVIRVSLILILTRCVVLTKVVSKSRTGVGLTVAWWLRAGTLEFGRLGFEEVFLTLVG